MTVLPEVLDCTEFVNADEIAKGISPLKPEEVAIEAGKIMLKRIDFLLDHKCTFAIETTLATRSYSNLIKRAQKIGYIVNILYFWLPSPEMAEERVAQRVATGGHNIPQAIIHRRYWRGLQNLLEIYIPIADMWSIYDNSLNQKPIAINNTIVDISKFNIIKTECLKKKN